MAVSWLDKQEQWDAAARAALDKGVLGLDSETYGHDVKESSPAYRAVVDVWSIALATNTRSPRGYRLARGAVLPAAALRTDLWRRVFGGGEVLCVLHNERHDRHALENAGVSLARTYDTLEAVRLLWPGRQGYTLKSLAHELLGKPKRELFKALTEHEKRPVRVMVQRKLEMTVCSCGVPKCRKKKGHEKHKEIKEWEDEVVKEKWFDVPIESIVPGHPRFERKLEYAGADAVDALELYELCQQRAAWMEAHLPRMPW